MSDSPKSLGSASTFMRASISVLMGAIALYLAVSILRSIALFIVGGLVLVALLGAIHVIRRGRNRQW